MATGKREKNFDRTYSDSEGSISIGHEGDTVAEIALNTVNPDVLTKAAMRYLADIVVGVGNAALKAEGGTIEQAEAKMQATVKALQDGTFKFRSATGQGGLSLEDEMAVVAETLVALGKAGSKEDALSKVQAVYARTKTNTKGYTIRPDYNALKAAPQVKAALALASKAGDNLDSILSV